MNKKILITNVFTILILLVSFNSVIGISDVEEDCGCEIVSKSNLVKVKRLLNRLEVYSKLLLVLSKNHPELVETSEELSNEIAPLKELKEELKTNSLLPENFTICIYLFVIYKSLNPISKILYHIFETIPKYPLLYQFLYHIVLNLYATFYYIVYEAMFWGDYYNCWWVNSR